MNPLSPVALAAATIGVGSIAGCSSTKYVDATTIQSQITKTVEDQTGFKPTDVKRPTDVEAKVGEKFRCHFSGSDDGAYTAYVKVTEVHGDKLIFDFKSQLSSTRRPPPSGARQNPGFCGLSCDVIRFSKCPRQDSNLRHRL